MAQPGLRALLTPAVEATRSALRRLDIDEVPPNLKRVASSSARRLPPPLMAAIFAELDTSEWLRSKALEELDGGGDRRGRRASYLFLDRPDGWEAELKALEDELSADRTTHRLDQVARDRDRLAERVKTLEAEVEEVRARSRDLDRRLKQEAEERSGGLRRRVSELESELRRAQQAATDRAEEVEMAIEALARADDRIGELRDTLLRERRREREIGSGGEWSFGRGSASEIARTLDHLSTVLTSRSVEQGVESSRPGISFPSDLRPDRTEAIEWLRGLGASVGLLVDGYNVAHLLKPGAEQVTRRRLQHELSGLRRLAEGPILVTLFWDSGADTDRRRYAGIDVAYVPNADDAIVAAVTPGVTVVISDDRELRERASEAGAVCLWGSALVGWINRPTR